MAEWDRVYSIRTAAGWECDDEAGWFAPDGTPEYEWDGPLPEDEE